MIMRHKLLLSYGYDLILLKTVAPWPENKHINDDGAGLSNISLHAKLDILAQLSNSLCLKNG